jgi:hypothetical protein
MVKVPPVNDSVMSTLPVPLARSAGVTVAVAVPDTSVKSTSLVFKLVSFEPVKRLALTFTPLSKIGTEVNAMKAAPSATSIFWAAAQSGHASAVVTEELTFSIMTALAAAVKGLLTVRAVVDATDRTFLTVLSPTKTVSPGPITVATALVVVEKSVATPATVAEPAATVTVPVA